MKKKYKINLAGIIIVLIVLLITFNVKKNTTTMEVNVGYPKEMEMEETILVPGTLKLQDEQKIFLNKNAGEIESFLVEEGDVVEQNQDLIRYSGENLKHEKQLNQLSVERNYIAINEVLDQIETLKEKKRNLAQEIGEKKAAEQFESQLEQLENQKRMANLDLKMSLLEKERLNDKLEALTVQSKISGTVVSVNKNPEQLGAEGLSLPLIHIANLDDLILIGNISSYDALKVEVGQKVHITSDAFPNKMWKGKVKSVADLPNSHSQSAENGSDSLQYPIKVEFNKNLKDYHLKPGFELVMEIVVSKKKTLTVPYNAIKIIEGNSYVFTVENGKASRKKVKTGLATDERIEIVNGMKADERIILNRTDEIVDGMDVKIK